MSNKASIALATKMKGMVEREVQKQLKALLREHVLLTKDEYRMLMERRSYPAVLEETEPQVELDPFAMARAAVEQHRKTQTIQKKQSHSNGIRTGNSALDSILNETRGGITSEYASYDSFGHFDTSTTHAVGLGAVGDTPQAPIPLQTVGLNTGRPVDLNSEAGQSVASALTRNYKDVLNAVKQKKGF